MPALDFATRTASGLRSCIALITPSISAGPLPQLPPKATRPISCSASTAAAGLTPIIVKPRVSNVIVTTMGSELACRAPSTAARTSCRSLMVSIHSTSTPPASSAAACWAKPSRASSTLSVPSGSISSPLGPIEPATTTRRPAASAALRTISAPARFSSATRSSSLCSFSRNGLPPNVFVRTICEPALIYASWTARTRSGCSTFQRSGDSPCSSPAFMSIVPIAPSASTYGYSSSSACSGFIRLPYSLHERSMCKALLLLPQCHELLCRLNGNRRVLTVGVGLDVLGERLIERRTAHEHDHIVTQALILKRLDHHLHVRHRRRQQRAHAQDVGVVLADSRDELVRAGVDPQINDFEARALHHHGDQVLADIVDVALDGADHHRADLRRAGFDKQRAQHRHTGLHRLGRHQHFRHKQDTIPEVDANDVHRGDKALVHNLKRAKPA